MPRRRSAGSSAWSSRGSYTRLEEVRRATAGLTHAYLVEVSNHSYNVFGFYECPRNIRRARPGTDNEFVHQFKFDGVRTSECRLSVVILLERNSSDPDGAAYLNVSAIDAAINP